MLTVRCLNWQNYQGRGDEYVGKLLSMCQRNLTIPFEFLDWSGDPNVMGWWNKLALIQQPFDDWVLYLDLDVVITGAIGPMIEAVMADRHLQHCLWMRDDFSYSIVHPRINMDSQTARLLGGQGCCNSSVMLYYQSVHLDDYSNAMEVMHGDQNVITAQLWPQHRISLLPNDVIKSYKYHPGEVAPIMVFHGNPKPHEVDDEWVKQHWS